MNMYRSTQNPLSIHVFLRILSLSPLQILEKNLYIGYGHQSDLKLTPHFLIQCFYLNMYLIWFILQIPF